MKTVLRLLLPWTCLTMAGDLRAQADEPLLEQRVGAATLRVAATVEKGAMVMALTDLLTIVVEVEGDATLDVRPPVAWIKGPWQARPARPADQKVTGNKALWKQVLHVEPVQPGENSLKVEPLRYRTSDGEWQIAAWKPLPVRVTSRLTQADVKNVRDITAIEELPAPPSKDPWQGWIIGGVFAGAALAVLLALWLRGRRPARLRATPEAWALYELNRLHALGLPDKAQHERFGTLLNSLVRRYLEKRFQLPARRQTTAEFLAALDGQAGLAEQRGFLETFMRRCDLLKFAPVASSADECRALAEQAGHFIAQQQQQAAPSGG